MTISDEKRLKELETKRKLVHKGTGKTFEVETWPGGVEVWVDDDTYKWTGTEDEEREYNALRMEETNKRSKAAFESFRKKLGKILYGGKYTS